MTSAVSSFEVAGLRSRMDRGVETAGACDGKTMAAAGEWVLMEAPENCGDLTSSE